MHLTSHFTSPRHHCARALAVELGVVTEPEDRKSPIIRQEVGIHHHLLPLAHFVLPLCYERMLMQGIGS